MRPFVLPVVLAASAHAEDDMPGEPQRLAVQVALGITTYTGCAFAIELPLRIKRMEPLRR